jgi:hypothetical protein
MTEEDRFEDFLIAVGCAIAIFCWIAYEIGQHNARKERTYCASTLADGRELTTTWLGPQGHAQCTYAPSYGNKRNRRG